MDAPTADGPADRLATRLKLNSSYPTAEGPQEYRVEHIPAGFGMMFGAGTLSGLLGIGSGAFKVLAMDQVMRVPFKVSTTTSNFMIGVTAAASAGIYLRRGFVAPGLVMPVVLGVLAGSVMGTRLLVRAKTSWLRIAFCVGDCRSGSGDDLRRDQREALNGRNDGDRSNREWRRRYRSGRTNGWRRYWERFSRRA